MQAPRVDFVSDEGSDRFTARPGKAKKQAVFLGRDDLQTSLVCVQGLDQHRSFAESAVFPARTPDGRSTSSVVGGIDRATV